MKRKILLVCLPMMIAMAYAFNAEDFNILIVRGDTKSGLVYGKLYLNGELVGNCYENDTFKIAKGKYKGLMRYNSGSNFVQSPLGKMANQGDFLLEVSGVVGRTDILLHAGNKPKHSKGCILTGPATKGPEGGVTIDKNHPLYILRVKFYGSEFPNASPNKNISIEVK